MVLPAWNLPAPNPKTPQQAVKLAEQEHNHPSRSWFEMCAKLCAHNYGWAGSGEYSARTLASRQVIHPEGVPDAGALCFWTVGQFDHVATSDGGGYVWSNDILRVGKVDRVRISYISDTWGAHYRGWSLPYFPNAYGPSSPPVPVEKPKPKPVGSISLSEILHAIDHGQPDPQIGTVARMLYGEGYRGFQVHDGKVNVWGPGKARAYGEWQRHLGAKKPSKRPTKYSLTVLGDRHSVDVTT